MWIAAGRQKSKDCQMCKDWKREARIMSLHSAKFILPPILQYPLGEWVKFPREVSSECLKNLLAMLKLNWVYCRRAKLIFSFERWSTTVVTHQIRYLLVQLQANSFIQGVRPVILASNNIVPISVEEHDEVYRAVEEGHGNKLWIRKEILFGSTQNWAYYRSQMFV